MGLYSLLGGKNVWKKIIQRKAFKKNKKTISISVLLLIAASCFFYAWNSKAAFYAQNYKQEELILGEFDLKKEFEIKTALASTGSSENKIAESNKEQQKTKSVEGEIYAIVGDSPMKKMVPSIARHDQTVAALIVGIAKKESNWGNSSPSLDGVDCFNYWGYKGAGSRGTAMGYGCFATPEEGVEVIGARIAQLVKKNLTTPSKMVVWKCGSSCAGHDPVAVQKWISDVDLYFDKILAVAG